METNNQKLGLMLSTAVGSVLIALGALIIFYVLPSALAIISMPAKVPFMNEMFNWLMAGSEQLSNQINIEFYQIFQACIKVVVVVVFIYACVKLVALGALIVKEGVGLIREAIKALSPPDVKK